MPHRKTPSVIDINKNTNWLHHPAAWVWYLGLVVSGWLVLSVILSDSGLAWTYTHLLHGVITYYLFHWTKGTPFVEEDQGKYDLLTFWEQLDSGVYATRNRKMLTLTPVVLFVLATHGTDFRKQPLGLNLAVVILLLVAKLPALHKVRIFGINSSVYKNSADGNRAVQSPEKASSTCDLSASISVRGTTFRAVGGSSSAS